MFAYCNNNPVVYYDVAGAFAVAIPLFAIGKILFDGCVSLMAVYAAWEIGTAIGEAVSQSQEQTDKFVLVAQTAVISPATHRENIAERISASYTSSQIRTYRTSGEWHHIVAKAAPNASYARKVLEAVGIGINSPENLIYIKTGLHRRLHTNEYYGWANGVVISAYRSAGGNVALKRLNVSSALGTLRAFVTSLDLLAPY